MRFFRRIASLLLVLTLLLTMLPQLALEASAENPRIRTGWSEWKPNPLYPDTPAPEITEEPGAAASALSTAPEDYLSLDAAAEYVRKQMAKRVNSITVSVVLDHKDPRCQEGSYADILFGEALEHTGVPDEGDYIYLHYGGWRTWKSEYDSDGKTYGTYTYNVSYYTTLEQEQELGQEIDRVLEELALEGQSDYVKLVNIYRYITEHVRYDWEGLYGANEKIIYTAYAALIRGKAVCQGYASLLYRMLLQAGVDCRCITGDSGGNHAWNIVRMGDLYYNVDVTWDAGMDPEQYRWLMKGSSSFDGKHTRDPEYLTEEFCGQYPTSQEDLDPDQVHTHTLTQEHFDASCTNGERIIHSCACGYQQEELLSYALGHEYSEWEIIIPATCQQDGLQERVCARCGEVDQYELWNGDHAWDGGIITREPTDDSEGEKTYTCTICGKTRVETLPQLHVHSYEVEIVWPDCTNGGYTVFTCSCGDSFIGEELQPLGHNYEEQVKEATCSELGWTTYTCTNCWDSYTASYENYAPCSYELTVVAPTCEDPGYHKYVCRSCESTYTDQYTDPLRHEWVCDWQSQGIAVYVCTKCDVAIRAYPVRSHEHDYEVTATEATCRNPGYTCYRCKECFVEFRADYVDPTQHAYAKAYMLPTCVADGRTWYFCHCGDDYYADYVPATGHSYEITEIAAPTCTTHGYTEYCCASCGDSYRDDFTPSTGHAYEETVYPGTCQEYGYKLSRCTRCGLEHRETGTEKGGHVWSEGFVRQEPTATKPGIRIWSCTLCGAWKQEEIPATGFPFVDVAESAYYYEPVWWALENAITSGTDDTHFSPNDNCTRGQVVTFLWRAAGCPEPAGNENPFTDVKESRYYYKAVLWAVEKGITSGVGGNRFAPDDEVTRAQMVTFLWRWAGQKVLPGVQCPFGDLKASAYYYDAVLWAVGHKITSGTSETAFSPNDPCTRAQVVTFLYRYDNREFVQGDWFNPPEGVEIFCHEDYQPAKEAEPGTLPEWHSEPTREDLMAVLEACSPDGAFFLRWDSDDFMHWIGGTDITADTDTAVHETYHGFSGSGNQGQRYYLGDGYYVDVETSYVFYSSEITEWIPQEHHTFRYDLYLLGSESPNMWSIIGGVYGLLNEFNGYASGMMYNVAMFDYFCAQGMQTDPWYDYVISGENNRMAYAEFRYWILTYLLYAQEHYPAVYEELMENIALRYAFTVVEGRYAENIERYDDQLEQLADDEIAGMEDIVITEDEVRFGAYGIMRFTDDYQMLMDAMAAPKYQQVLEAFRIG